MSNLISLKSDFANTLQNTNKKKSHSKFVTSKSLLEDSDFKKFLDLYLTNETEFFERIDGYDGFISTQQIESINYENFAEHVFFDSAVEKVNYSFSKSINEFPYDGTKYQLSQYLKKLDGFTKYVLDNKVNKSLNYLNLENGNSIVLKDKKGNLLKDYIGNKSINNFNPQNKTFSFDFWLYPKNTSNDQLTSCLFYKYSNKNGFLITLELNDSSCNIKFYFINNNSFYTVSYPIKLNEFSHIFLEVENTNTKDNNNEITKKLNFYINGKEIKSGINESGNINIEYNFDDSNFINSDVYLGGYDLSSLTLSNINQDLNDINFSSFEGIIDEFKFYIGKKRDYEDILRFKDENTNSQESLVLYYRFNEPSGQYSNNHIVLDYSGNKLHGEIKNRNNGSYSSIQNFERNGLVNDNNIEIKTPLIYENIKINPILFSSHSQNNKQQMISNASEYDLINPNSFWKLMPKNIFLEGSDYDNVDQTYINDKTLKNNNILGTERSINQEIIKLISVWARFFDQIKTYIDSFTELLNFNYDSINKNKKIDGMILPLALNQMGFKFRELYAFPIKEKLENKNLSYKEVMSTFSVRQIQNILWKRFILNSKDYLMSKGTIRSIQSVFNSFGLESSKYIRIKEISGQNNLNINNQFYSNRQNVKFIDFNKHNLIFEPTSFDQNTSLPLNKINYSSDLFTKDNFYNLDENTNSFEKNWTFEFYFNFDKLKLEMFDDEQSLIRLDRKTSQSGSYSKPHINITFKRKNNEIDFGDLKFSLNINDVNIVKTLNDVHLFNGHTYYLCLRKKYIEDKNIYQYQINLSPIGQLSYTYNKNIILETESNYIDEEGITNYYQFNIGEYDYDTEDSIVTSFQGKISQIRLYDKFLDNNILRNKSKDIYFIGEKTNDLTSKNLYVNIDLSQKISDINLSNEYNLYNFINNLGNRSVNQSIRSSLKIGSSLLESEEFNYEKIFTIEDLVLFKQNYEIDSSSNSNKVYINSFEDDTFKDQYKNFNISSSSQLHPEYMYHDDQRLYIDFSAVHFLNQDISKLLSINEYFTEKLSISSYLYEEDYTEFSKLRDEYFKRIKKREEINFNMLYQVYKYFDNVLEDLLYEAIPSRVNYLGFNFVYESHILERNKYRHKNFDSRLPYSSSKEFKYQHYDQNLTKHRSDDLTNNLNISVIKKY